MLREKARSQLGLFLFFAQLGAGPPDYQSKRLAPEISPELLSIRRRQSLEQSF
jgi:hypothetical protein